MATTLSILAMRSAAFSACLRPSSERCSPAARPGSLTPVVGVRPWRTSSTTVEGRGRFAFMRRRRHHRRTCPLTLPSPPLGGRDERSLPSAPIGERDGKGKAPRLGGSKLPPHPALSPVGGEG